MSGQTADSNHQSVLEYEGEDDQSFVCTHTSHPVTSERNINAGRRGCSFSSYLLAGAKNMERATVNGWTNPEDISVLQDTCTFGNPADLHCVTADRSDLLINLLVLLCDVFALM